MQTAFIALLLGVLLAAMASFAAMGLAQRRRARALARGAHEMGLRFSIDDPFDVPRRYADFALITRGHSPIAHNVIHGRVGGVPVRCFDFRYELGHGTRRITRRYGVVVVELARPLPGVLMWHDADGSPPPLELLASDGHLRHWTYVGNGAMAGRLAALCADLGEQGASLQTCGCVAMMCSPIRRRGQDYAGSIDRIVSSLRCLAGPEPLQGGIASR